MQSAMWDRLIALPLHFFRDYSAGDLAIRAMNIEAIRQTLSVAVLSPLLNGVFSIFNLGLLIYYDSILAQAAIGLLLIALIISTGSAFARAAASSMASGIPSSR